MRDKYHDGRHKHPLYHTWNDMVRRCTDRKKADYIYYGGRGITLHPSWLDFWQFVKDMGVKPSGATLDRIDNDRGYSPSNCRWTSVVVQSRNKRSNKLVTWAGESMILIEMAELLEINYSTLRSRVRRTGDIFNTQRNRKQEDAIFIGRCAIEVAKQVVKDNE